MTIDHKLLYSLLNRKGKFDAKITELSNKRQARES